MRLPIFNLRVHVYILCKRSPKKKKNWSMGSRSHRFSMYVIIFYGFFPGSCTRNQAEPTSITNRGSQTCARRRTPTRAMTPTRRERMGRTPPAPPIGRNSARRRGVGGVRRKGRTPRPKVVAPKPHLHLHQVKTPLKIVHFVTTSTFLKVTN